jgi:hypothetical protein
MKHIKMLGLAVVAAAALMALVGASTASAAALYSGATKQGVGTKIESTGTNAVLKAGFATITCGHSEVDGKVENAGGVGVPVSGAINRLTFTECNATVNVLKRGELIVHHIAGSDDGTVTSKGAEVTVSTAGTSCTYGTPNATHIGVLTGGSPATLHASASLTRIAGGFLCANPATWTATYTVSTPNPAHITAS